MRTPRRLPISFVSGCVFILILLLSITPAAVSAATFTVSTGANDGDGSLRAAITAANSSPDNDTINIAVQLITLTTALPSINNNGTLTINGNGVSIFRDSTTPQFRIFQVSSGANVTLDDMTISGGNVGSDLGGGIYNFGTLNGSGVTITENEALWGAGIYNAGGTVTLSDSLFTFNTSTVGGGGILNNGGTLNATDTTFANNASAFGGGAYNFDGGLNLTTSTFTGNSATNGGGIINNSGSLSVTGGLFDQNSAESGGAIYSSQAETTLNEVEFSANNAEGSGGALGFDGGTGIITSSLFSNNVITGVGSGGAIYIGGEANVSLTESTLNGNVATANGGGIINGGGSSLSLTDTHVGGNNAPYGGGIFNGSVLDISGGSVSGNTSQFDGAGIHNSGGSITMASSTVNGNFVESVGNGGGIWNSGTLALTNISVLGNTVVDGEGGGLANDGGTVTLTGSSVNDNGATTGGGISNLSGSVTVSNSEFDLNIAAFDSGGGSISNAGTLAVDFSFFSASNAGTGGGIRNLSGATATVISSTFLENTATADFGGGIYNNGTITVTGSTLDSNTAVIEGGGLYNLSTATVINSTFTLNSADVGGGIASAGGTATVINSTLSRNSALTIGGGVYNSTGATLNLQNSIVANSDSGGECQTLFATTNVEFSIIEGSLTCVTGTNISNMIADPNLAAFTGNPGYFPLNTGSPAIDAGSNALLPSGIVVDQPGNFRIAGETVDMGSSESGSSPAPVVSITPSSASVAEGSSADFTISRTGATTSGLVVTLQVLPADADTTTDDYTLSGGSVSGQTGTVTVIIPAGMASTTLNIAAADDIVAEPDNALTIEVVNTFTYTSSFTQGSATVTIPASDLVVTTLDDEGEGSLRQAIANANTFPSDDTITFTIPGSITLTTGQLTLVNNGSLTINGAGQVTVGGDGVSEMRVFEVLSGANVSLIGLTVTNGLFTGDGGAMYNDGTLTVDDSAIIDSAADGGGGGIFNANALTVTNSTFSGNEAATGGAIANGNGGTLIVNNSTLSDNAATTGGGVHTSGSATTHLNNTIVANSSAGGECVTDGGTTHASHSLIEGGLTCVNGTDTSNLTDDPELGPLSGSPAYFPLSAGSPAVDAGDNALIPDGVTTDQAGGSRIIGGTVDMGSFEFGGTPSAWLTVNLALQGRPPAPHASYVVTAQVQVRPAGSMTPILTQDFVTNSSGQFTIPNLTPADYDIRIKTSGTLAQVYPVTLVNGANTLNVPADQPLRAGDANGDNIINLIDFSLLASSFGTATGDLNYNPDADFNNDGFINLVDFSLLASNFNTAGAP